MWEKFDNIHSIAVGCLESYEIDMPVVGFCVEAMCIQSAGFGVMSFAPMFTNPPYDCLVCVLELSLGIDQGSEHRYGFVQVSCINITVNRIRLGVI